MAALPMFPLGSVLFPSLVLPLHVFEPRYRALVDDVLAGDAEFGVVLITRGSEVGGGDVRSSVGTVAHVLEAGRFPDGRWALQTVGTRRIEVVEWLPDDPYPRAEVLDLHEPDEVALDDALVATTTRLLRSALAKAGELGDTSTPATIELDEDPSLASYQMSALAPLPSSDQYRLLAAPDAASRLALLHDLLVDVHAVLDFRLGAGPGGIGP